MTERAALDLDGTGPEGFGYLALLRLLERRAGDRPRIGESRRIRDEYVRMGQDPFLAFPDNELTSAHRDAVQRLGATCHHRRGFATVRATLL